MLAYILLLLSQSQLELMLLTLYILHLLSDISAGIENLEIYIEDMVLPW